MKAITICQPYAHLIMLPASDPRHKRCENRRWDVARRCGVALPTSLLIHAGKSWDWLELDLYGKRDVVYDLATCDMAFGAIVGVAQWYWCGPIERIGEAEAQHPGMCWRLHSHTEGPYCLLLRTVQRFPTPVPYKGRQGMFDVPESVVAEQLAKAVPA